MKKKTKNLLLVLGIALLVTYFVLFAFVPVYPSGGTIALYKTPIKLGTPIYDCRYDIPPCTPTPLYSWVGK